MRDKFLIAFLQILLSLVTIALLPQVVKYFGLDIIMPGSASRRNYRSSLVSSMINKLNEEENLKKIVESGVWYEIPNLHIIQDVDIVSKFVQLSCDQETSEFIRHSAEQSDWLFTQIYQNIAKAFLGWFYTQTDINAILNRGSMFVLSRDQFTHLTDNFTGDSMIDLGAGDGKPTLSMAPSFSSVYATENSAPMRKMLAANNIQVLEVATWQDSGPFDLISCLNLLDRADNPLTILRSVKQALKSTGLLVVALVLPFRPYVESTVSHKPSELMDIQGKSAEEQLVSAVQIVQSLGFRLTKWSKVPYLCEGDLSQPIYHLTDYIMIFKNL